MNYNIIIADDHQLIIDGIKLILNNISEYNIIAEAGNGEELLNILEQSLPHIIITDLNMPGMRGTDLIKQIKTKYPDVKVLVISMHDEQEIINEILLAEAEGYILKNSGKQEVLAAVNDVLEGKTHYGKKVLESILKTWKTANHEQQKFKLLSQREKEVLDLILDELTSKEIAEKLNISKQTVDTHRSNIMDKTGAKTLVGLIKLALAKNI